MFRPLLKGESVRLSTSTNIYFNRPDHTTAPIEQSIRLCGEAGYRVMDMNFYDCTTFKLPFITEQWEKWIYGILETAQDSQIQFSQGHANFYNFCDPDAENKEFLDRMVLRSIDCASILGIPWLVIHAGTDFASPTLVRSSKEKNIEYFKPVLEYAKKRHVGIAIENLWDLNIAPLRRYTTTAEELVDLVDSLRMDFNNVGICWDVEHADIMKQAQEPALRMIGSRLKATHISDNVGIDYDHVLPYSGYTGWEAFMKILKEIKYSGDLTYEIHRYTSQLPDPLVPAALRYSVEVGNYLLSLAE